MKVSTLLLTFNEERNLPPCLRALAWCDDIIVVDSGSTDSTREIALQAGARVLQRPFDDFASQRNFGLEKGEPRHEWVLHLDADEIVTQPFLDRLNALEEVDGIDAYRVPSKIVILGHWLRYAGMYPAYQVRLGRRDRLRFKQVGHGQREDLPPAAVGTFNEPYLHFNFSHGLAAWLRRHVRYAEEEARQLVALRTGRQLTSGRWLGVDSTDRRRRAKDLAAKLPLMMRPASRFLYVFVWRRGFLDGRYGLLYALMLSVYEGMIAILAAEEISRERSTESPIGPRLRQ
jgi:glycosyltransferase involved in cell wall biosynthesis